MNNLQTQADYAISKFESCYNTFNNLQEDNIKFTHWDDIINKTLDVWYNKYDKHIKLCNSEKEFSDLITKFHTEIVKIFSKKSDYATYKTYYSYVIDFQVKQIKNELMKCEQKENNEVMIDQLRNMKLARQPQVKLKEDPQIVNAYNPLIFNLTHMMRCHSKQNDPSDNTSPVKDISFEISNLANSFDSFPIYTDLFATCGQNIINLIDAQTGKVLQRFNDDSYINNSKESYNRLAWTILNNVSILAGAGTHGQIKLIVPKYSVCLSRIEAHKSEISFLLFHPKYPNILISSSDDFQIKLWKLNFFESNSCTECELTYEKLAIIEYKSKEATKKKEKVNSMCFASNNILLISTDVSNYGVYLDEEKLFGAVSNQDDMNSNDDIVSYLTTKPKENTILRIFTAQELYIISYTSNNISFEDSFIANKIFYFNNLLVACIAGSEMVYIIKMNDLENFKGQVVSHIKLIDHKNELNLMPSYYKNNELNKYVLLRPTSNSLFECIALNSEISNIYTVLRFSIPTEYTIKNQKDLTKIPVKDYNLLEKASVLACVSNGNFIVASTDQNIISIWSKSK